MATLWNSNPPVQILFTVNTDGDIITKGILSLGTTGDQGSIRYNATDDVIEFTNDGSTWLPLGAATAR